MSLENTLREMLSEQNRPGPGIGPFGGEPVLKPKETIDLSTGKPYVRPPKKPSSTSIPNPAPAAPVVNPKPKAEKDNIKSHNPKGLKEFYKARLEGALLSEREAHEMSALEGARREARSKMVDKVAAGILAGGVAAGGFGVGNLAAGSLIPTDVATHNAEVAAGEVVPPKGVSIGQVRATAKPSPAYGAFQRAAIAAREAARAKGKKGK